MIGEGRLHARRSRSYHEHGNVEVVRLASKSNVVRLTPPPLAPATFSDARARWEQAEIRSCLEALQNDPSADAAILAARCLLRLNRPVEAVERLNAASPALASCKDAARGEYAIVKGLAHFRMGDEDLTNEALFEARAYVYSTSDRCLEAELDLVETQVAWGHGDLGRGKRLAERACTIAPTAKWRARALEFRGIIAGAEGKPKQQVDYFEQAWAALDEGGEKEPWFRAALLHAQAELADGLFRRDLAERLSEREQSILWNADTEYMRFGVLHHTARCFALAGDHLRAFRLLRQASDIAPSLAWRIMIFAERSSLAAEMGERLFASEELDQAHSFASSHNWSQSRGGERFALLRLAQITAPTDPAGARALLDIYRKNLPPIAGNTISAHDGRMAALEACSFGIVALYSGDTIHAIDRLKHAFSIWRSLDFVWRALSVAIALSRLTGADVFAEYIARHVPSFPGTWLEREAATLQHLDPDPAVANFP